MKQIVKIDHIDRWYDRCSRSWIVQKMDAEGNQIDEAFYSGTKLGAIMVEKEWKIENNLKQVLT